MRVIASLDDSVSLGKESKCGIRSYKKKNNAAYGPTQADARGGSYFQETDGDGFDRESGILSNSLSIKREPGGPRSWASRDAKLRIHNGGRERERAVIGGWAGASRL
ncbi:hypothetical protein EVAR_48653_1 [Eumeta japonica]|uniref:Uncharacterized protein n=1 Tax=Eumeta variegata TaxID=151549 RepID=A0A4C1XC13_EUMVA|nr:hypothetical protein EVAR_48653_1 [Eumeta japonica]